MQTDLTQEQRADLDALTAPFVPGWDAGDSSDAEWRQAVKDYCRRTGTDFDAAARYLQMPGHRD
jgi:hypothetical protein